MTKLLCAKNKILAHKTLTDDILKKEFVQYFYTEEKLTPEKNEVNRSENSYTIHLGENRYKTRFYTWNKFHKIDDNWYEVRKANLTPEEWALEGVK